MAHRTKWWMLAALLFAASPAIAQEVIGDWHGTLAIPTGALRFGLTVKPKSGGGYEGAMHIPDQTANDLPLDEVKLEDGALSFAFRRAGISYSGRWDDARKAWVGEFRQGVALSLVLTAGRIDALPVIAGLDGDWAGTITPAGASTIRLIVHIRTDARGTVANLDSPDQLALGVPLGSFRRDGEKVSFDVSSAHYEGTLSADGHTIAGTWTGVSYKGPLTFASRPVTTAAPNRPQTPKPPFPYRTEEVTVKSAAGVTLAGTLTLPQGKGPFPAVVMITGSGAQDRDETILGHKPFAVIADRLTRDGIAVLRVDDRGTAKSTGDFTGATDDDFAVDAAANVAFLRGRSDIDPARIGLIGHSEGGIVAPKVAAADPKLAFIVLMAGPGVKGSDLARAQRAALGAAMGVSPDRIQRTQVLVDHAIGAMRAAKDDADASARALAVIKAEGGDIAPTPVAMESMAAQLSSGWMRSLVDYDPAPTLGRVKAPILALNGAKDKQVPPEQNLPAVRKATQGNPDVTIMELPGLNHLFQTATTGAPGEYADIEETIAPSALDIMSAWIKKHAAK